MEKWKVPVIETKRLVLRAITLDDVDDMYEICSNPNVTKFLTYDTHKNKEETKFVIENMFLKRPENGIYESYVIVYKENNKVIGTCDYVGIRRNTVSIGYMLNESYWNQGIMSEALNAVIDMAFNTLGFERIFIEHDPENIGSKRVIEKAGFKRIGLARKVVPLANGFGDSIQYDLLKEDLGGSNR